MTTSVTPYCHLFLLILTIVVFSIMQESVGDCTNSGEYTQLSVVVSVQDSVDDNVDNVDCTQLSVGVCVQDSVETV